MNVLGVETSCDETSAAVVRDGRHVLSNIIFSQIALHKPYGGVVPEIASRSHVENISWVIEKAVSDSDLDWSDIDKIAMTYGPGLASSLLVGVSAAKGLALKLNKPLCAINHVEAHIYSVFLGDDAPKPEDVCPFIALVVSGGHTSVVRVEKIGSYKLLGQTIDDAAGEAFDKGANLLGLGYPGGPIIDKVSRDGNPKFIHFPRGVLQKKNWRFENLDPKLCFSFSGLKTALLYYLKDNPLSEERTELPDIAASYQDAIVDALLKRCERAVDPGENLAVVGGVSLNSRLRFKLGEFAEKSNIRLMLAKPSFCADNAAMISGLAGNGCGIMGEDAITIDAFPNLTL